MSDNSWFDTYDYRDSNRDGEVDMVERLRAEEEFQRIYGKKEDDDLASDNDWEIECLSEAEEYGLDPYDYMDRDEFETALEEAKMKSDDSSDDVFCNEEDSDDDFDSDDIDDDTDAAVFPEGFDFSRLKFTIGSEVKVTLDDDNSKKDTKTDFVPHTKSVQIKYYDKENKKYKVAEAVFDYFKIARDNYDLTENTYIPDILYDLYNYDKEQAIKIWRWILEKFPKMLVNDGVNDWDTQAESYTGITFNNFHCIDNENDSDYIYDYVSKNKDIEETLFCKSYFGDDLLYLPEYLAYCVEQNLKENVERIYFGIVHHPFRNKKTCSLYKVLDDILAYCSINGVQNADPWFYAFFEKQIKGLNKPVKENALMLRLNAENYGKPIFSRPNSKTIDHKPLTIKPKIEEHSADEDFDFVVDTVSQDEVAKLREELSMVKSKCETFEEQIKKLTAEIKTLKAQNEPEAFYCRIHFENSAKGQAFWYKCDDTTVKVGDTVTAPFGYKNDELIGTVVEAGYFKSCDFDFPISKMKAIIKKGNKDVEPKSLYCKVRVGSNSNAIGGAIHHIGNIHKYARPEDVPEQTMFIITTDGAENASHRYTADRVKKMIERQKEKYGWEFLFIGANIDAVETAGRYGIAPDRAVNYHADQKGTQVLYENLSAAVCNVRASKPLTTEWCGGIKADFENRGKYNKK